MREHAALLLIPEGGSGYDAVAPVVNGFVWR